MKSGNNFATHAIMDNPESQTEFPPLPSPAPLLEKAPTPPSPDSPAVTVRDLSVAFGEHRVLKAVSLHFPARTKPHARLSADRPCRGRGLLIWAGYLQPPS